MTEWGARASEERALFNPCFCSVLLWSAASGYQEESPDAGLPFELAFLVLPFVLHRETRESLPKVVKTSLAVWLDNNPLARSRISDGARLLVPFTKLAMRWAGSYGLLRFDSGQLRANEDQKKTIAKTMRSTSDEANECAKKAEFVGRWLASTGSAETVMALIGVRP